MISMALVSHVTRCLVTDLDAIMSVLQRELAPISLQYDMRTGQICIRSGDEIACLLRWQHTVGHDMQPQCTLVADVVDRTAPLAGDVSRVRRTNRGSALTTDADTGADADAESAS